MGKNDWQYTGGGISDDEKRAPISGDLGKSSPEERDRESRYNPANKSRSDVIRSVMGRQVIHHSPDKHPEQGDPLVEMDFMTEKAAKEQPSTMEQMRKKMKPMQRESPKPAQGLMDYIKRLGGQR